MTVPGPFDLGPVFLTDDVGCVVTLDGSGTIAGMTFALRVLNPDGTVLIDSSSSSYVQITDAANRKVTWTLVGFTFVVGVYRWELRRTDAGSRTLCSYGSFRAEDADTEPLRG